MAGDAEGAERRRKKAEHISIRTKEQLTHMLLEFHALMEAGRAEAKKVNKKRKTAAEQLEIKAILEREKEALQELTSKYERRIVNFIREQITSDDGKYL